MRVYLAISYFDEVGGSEEQLTLLATYLKELGHQVVVFNKLPENKKSQYVQRLNQEHIRIVSPSPWVARLLGDWYYQDAIVQGLGKAAAVVLSPVAITIALLRKKPYAAALESVAGRARSVIGKVLYKDRREGYMRAALNAWSIFRRPDIFHVFRYDLHAFLPWAKRKGIPSVYYELITLNTESLTDPAWKARSENINQATLIHAISESTLVTMRDGLGITRPIDVVYPFLKEIPAADGAGKEDATSPFTITCIGRLSPEKGLPDLLTAAKCLLASHPELKFLIAGSGPLRESLEQQARELGVDRAVNFYGSFPHSDLRKIMAVTDIFVLPSYLEGLPFVIVEAMAYAKPVVATSVGGVTEVVTDQQTGLVVPPGAVESLTRALQTLVEDAALRYKMGSAGREKVLTGAFSVDAFIKKVLAGYEKARRLSRGQAAVEPA